LTKDKGLPKFKRGDAIQAAKDLYEQYNKYVAEGNLAKLQEFCSERISFVRLRFLDLAV
jgi:hypothetical protein